MFMWWVYSNLVWSHVHKQNDTAVFCFTGFCNTLLACLYSHIDTPNNYKAHAYAIAIGGENRWVRGAMVPDKI